jgi:hypothetical protein
MKRDVVITGRPKGDRDRGGSLSERRLARTQSGFLGKVEKVYIIT